MSEGGGLRRAVMLLSDIADVSYPQRADASETPTAFPSEAVASELSVDAVSDWDSRSPRSGGVTMRNIPTVDAGSVQAGSG